MSTMRSIRLNSGDPHLVTELSVFKAQSTLQVISGRNISHQQQTIVKDIKQLNPFKNSVNMQTIIKVL